MGVSEKAAAAADAAVDDLAAAASTWQRHVCGVTACLPDNAHAAGADVPVDVQRRLGLASRDGVTTLGATGVWTHGGSGSGGCAGPAALLVPASLVLAVRAHRRRFAPPPDGGGGGGGGGGRTVVVEGFKLSGSAASFDLTVLRAYRCVFGAQGRAALQRVETVPGWEVEEGMDEAAGPRLSHCLCRVSLSRSGCDGVFGVEEAAAAAAAAVAGTPAELTYDGLSALLVGAGAAPVSWPQAQEPRQVSEEAAEEQSGPSVELVLGHAFCSGTPVLGALFDVWASGGGGHGVVNAARRSSSGRGKNVHSCMEGALVVKVEAGGGGNGTTSTPCVLACTPKGGWAVVPLAAFGGAAVAAALPQEGDSSRESKALSGCAAERVLSVVGGDGGGGFVDDASFIESVGFVKCTFDGDGGDGDGRGTLSQADGRCSAGGGDGRDVVHDRVAVQSSKRGSCVRLSESVYVTNAHVVAPEAAHHVLSRVTVSQPARRGARSEAALPSFGAAYEMRVSEATLAFASKGSVDAAMLVASANPSPVQTGSGGSSLRLAEAAVRAGHPVAVVGFPQGEREPVEVSHGVVTRALDGCYIVSAKVQPGCSGGGLFSRLTGECLGMATACLHDEAGKVLVPDIGMCVPASDLLPFVAALGGGGEARLESTYNAVSFEREALWQLSVGGSAADTLRALNKHVLRMRRGVRVPAMPASMKGSALFNYTRAVLSEAPPAPPQPSGAEGEGRAKL